MATEHKVFKLAIDGPSGVGKSTTASLLALNLKFIRVDSGTLYRAMTYIILKKYKKIDTEIMKLNEDEIKKIKFTGNTDNIIYKGQNIKPHLKESIIDSNVSLVSSFVYVREKINDIQHSIVKNIDSSCYGGVIIDGRDIGTVILPDADLKIFLTAKKEVRALRRWNELEQQGSYDDVLKEMIKRDHLDVNRKVGALKKAEDAIVIDNTDLTLEEQVDRIQNLVYERIENK